MIKIVIKKHKGMHYAFEGEEIIAKACSLNALIRFLEDDYPPSTVIETRYEEEEK